MKILFWCIVVIVVGVLLSKKAKELIDEYDKDVLDKYNNTRQETSRVCPFCGRTNYQYYTPAKEWYPSLYQCYDCKRYYGNVPSMTPAEKLQMECSDYDCQRIEQMPELNNVINAVITSFKNYRKGTKDLGSVSIKNGRVEASFLANGDIVKIDKKLLCTYSASTEIGDRWLCYLCYQKVKSAMPFSTFYFGEDGIMMETSNM